MQYYLFDLNEIVREILLKLRLLLAEVRILSLHYALHRFGLLLNVYLCLVYRVRDLHYSHAVVFQAGLYLLNFVCLDALYSDSQLLHVVL